MKLRSRIGGWSATGLTLVLSGCFESTPTATPPVTSTVPATSSNDSGPVGQPARAPASEPAADAATPPVAATPPRPAPPAVDATETGFQPLRFEDFEVFTSSTEPPAKPTWTHADGIIASTGRPKGYLYTKESYENCTLRADLRHVPPKKPVPEAEFKGNTGFLVYISGEPKLWPLCLEVQGKHKEMGMVRENGGAQPVVARDKPDVRERSRRPPGEWNSFEIQSKGGALRVLLNGEEICDSDPNFLSAGAIGIQAEDQPFEIANLRIRREPPAE